MKVPVSKLLSGSLLVAGTAIGAGMLALPVATAQGGFFPSLLLYVTCWLFMAITGLLMLEICLWMPKDSNLVSMSYHLLGTKGKMISWVLYLFLFYCLTIAYVAGGGGFISAIFSGSIGPKLGIGLFVLLFAPIVYLGTKAVDKINMVLMVLLCLSYFCFVFLGYKQVKIDHLLRFDFTSALFALPIVFTSFSYQGLIPSLTSYMNHAPKAVRFSILLGTAIPFVIYVIWQFLILGIVPLEGASGLLEAKRNGQNAVFCLKDYVSSPWIYAIGQTFAFSALTTSFLGVSLGLVDFLADGLKVPKKGINKLFLCLAVFVPPSIIACSNPKIFLSALTYAGGIGCALLLGLFPVLMVWKGRYQLGYGNKFAQVLGGKKLLILLAAFVAFEVLIEIIAEIRG